MKPKYGIINLKELEEMVLDNEKDEDCGECAGIFLDALYKIRTMASRYPDAEQVFEAGKKNVMKGLTTDLMNEDCPDFEDFISQFNK